MPSLVLHHYPMSPYAEKIRAMLGYSAIPWQSALTREMPPRPVLEALAGGYRKIPVAQLGADVFCDTRIISAEIATLAGIPALAYDSLEGEARRFVEHTEGEMFFVALMNGSSKALMRKVRDSLSWLDIARFFWDRLNMGRTSRVRKVGAKEARQMFLAHLDRLETLLQQPFLFGDTPSNADFAAYHTLWFIRDLAERRDLAGYPRVNAWMDRIKAFGHGSATPITGENALAQARVATPRAVPDDWKTHALIGQRVSIVPTDYAQVATAGTLVGVSATRYIIARDGVQTGVVHVHFPVDGYRLEALS